MKYRGVAVSGKAGAGKDTFIRYLQDVLAERGIWSGRVGFADEVKRDVLEIYGLAKADPGGREKLIEYSNAARAENPLVWIERYAETTGSLSAYGVVPLIADLRYQNEMDWCEQNGYLTVRVDATGMDRATALALRGEDTALAYSDTVSEVELDDAVFDLRFWNPHGSVTVLPHFAIAAADLFDGTIETVAA